MSILGDRLRLARKRKGWTQAQLASALGVKESTVNRYENGGRQPDFEQLTNIANLLEVSLEYLAGRSENPKIPERENDKDHVFDEIDTLCLHQLGDYTKKLPPQAQEQLREIIIAYLKTYPRKVD
ncbi:MULTISPECIES: helix-turn-helix domain-containing protein [Thermoactinomyces]|uniref:Helix-turn-helix transcriptional regulator n=1 Tax=Thermoactinomyces daqus TaxID=1329516 RepID=A0A7W1XC69_9BACL|nr:MULTISPECIES: helix-turn-helix transcriptional regulator [Thermoactinomyces]MBA4543963.1 helix-turn-helix transcriptional regulator [Thermoactinomyces daqus]MBH8599103.1 helix-turn-helix transcriptional regulator [Thermoactinomyces sp. CICC 10523]MBH8607965.1 helix-turn-helix transcriptional regulator [Thermoactinomyces sp. CICC 10521]